MKKFKFSVLMLSALALASCSDDADVPSPSPSNGDNAISFSTYVGGAASRATTTDLEALKDSEGFGVYAIYTGTGDHADITDFTPNFMNNQQVKWDGAAWSYSPVKYWPNAKTEKVSFVAYAPYQSGNVMSVAETGYHIALPPGSTGDGTILTYHIGTDVTKQKDVLVARARDQTNEAGTVNFEFKHALSRVAFYVHGWNYTTENTTVVQIHGISLSTKSHTGYLNLDEGCFSGTLGESTTGFVLNGDLLQNTKVTVRDQGQRLNTDDAYIMMLPDLEEGQRYCVCVDYTVSTVDTALASGGISIRNKAYVYIAPKFEAGKSYNLMLELGFDNNNPGIGDTEQQPDDPDPVDPNPGDGPDPEPAGNGSLINFTATVSDWALNTTNVTVNP